MLQSLSNKDFGHNMAKCQLAVTNVPFLGHLILSAAIKPNPKSLDVIRNVPIPQSITKIRSFLESVSYLRKFLPHLRDYAELLQHLTPTSEQTKFEWSDECTTAFNKLKLLLTNDLQLTILDPDCLTILATDASNIGLSACLSHIA
uniref:RNA-directed DNA polymerase n=1 Tax=Romanomermis culicivorax TaxID=13658 RepID=A0A915IBA5_ROMCU